MRFARVAGSLLLAPLLFFAFAPPLAAWNDAVHRAVARVAQERVNENVQRRHRYLMGTGAKFENEATWADAIIDERPETEAWHSITIPPGATRLDLDRDCPVGDCVTVQLRNAVGIVRLAVKEKPEIIEAFRFLLNLTIDLHQPLHVGYPPGEGGDETPVIYRGQKTTLREVWHGAILGDQDVDALADRIRRRINEAEAAEWTRGSIKDWTWDTHLTAVRVAYGALPAGSPKKLDDQYVASARAAAETQLAKAAVRLAALLEETWMQ